MSSCGRIFSCLAQNIRLYFFSEEIYNSHLLTHLLQPTLKLCLSAYRKICTMYVIKIMFLSYSSLWKYGGTYLDLDVIVKKGFNILKPNYAGAESEKAVAAGVLNFDDKNFGHQIADMCIRFSFYSQI